MEGFVPFLTQLWGSSPLIVFFPLLDTIMGQFPP